MIHESTYQTIGNHDYMTPELGLKQKLEKKKNSLNDLIITIEDTIKFLDHRIEENRKTRKF